MAAIVTLRLIIDDPVPGVRYSLQKDDLPFEPRTAGDGPIAFEVPITLHPDGRAELANLDDFVLPVLLITAAMTALNYVVQRQPAQTHAAPAGSGPPRFLQRFPARLKGAELYAVSAEDHYLRVHTSAGQDLILLRMADAIAELAGQEGMQVHRSWWVARSAIVDARRGDGRATLTLKDGTKAPVSRTYAAELRRRGWI